MASYNDLDNQNPYLTAQSPDGSQTKTGTRQFIYNLLDQGWTLISGTAFDYLRSPQDGTDNVAALTTGNESDAGKVLQVSEDGEGYELVHEPGAGGYEFTGGFELRDTNPVEYTTAMRDNDQWLRFGFTEAKRTEFDSVYWTDPDSANDPDYDATKGLFGGLHNPSGVTRLVDFTFSESPGYSAAVTGQSLNYTAASGSLDFSSCSVGDKAQVRFDFEVTPQIANTTIEIAMIWQTRDSGGNQTDLFALTGTPIFYGTGTVGKTFLNRPEITAYFASNEDVRAKALLAVKADNPIEIKPITTLVTIQR